MDPGQQPPLTSPVRVLQVIIAAMAIGALAVLVVAYFVHDKVGIIDKTQKLDIVTHLALLYGVVALIGGPIFAGALAAKGRQRLAQGSTGTPPSTGKASGFGSEIAQAYTGQLASLLVSKTIISGALYEGAALFLAVAYLLNGGVLTAGCSLIMVAALLMQIPTNDRAQRWIEGQVRQIEQERVGSKL